IKAIGEWKSPDFHNLGYVPLALAILALAGLGVFKRRHDLFLPALALGFAFLALEASRNQPLFAIVFLVVVAGIAAERWPWARQATRSPTPTRARLNLALILAGVVVAASLLPRAPGLQLHAEGTVTGPLPYPKDGAA